MKLQVMRAGIARDLEMKYGILASSAAIILLSACATVETQSAANTALDAAVVADEAVVADANAASAVTTAENQASEDRIVCKRTISTGTRLGAKRQCMTVREWREMREATRDIMDEGQRRIFQVDVGNGQ